MNAKQVYKILARLNSNETMQCDLIIKGNRQALLIIYNDRKEELARKEFVANPSEWNMDSKDKNTLDPSWNKECSISINVEPERAFLKTLNELDVRASGFAICYLYCDGIHNSAGTPGN